MRSRAALPEHTGDAKARHLVERVSYPGFQLGRELGLELADGAVGVVPLDEDFGSDGCLLPHVLQAVSLEKTEDGRK